MLRNYIEEAVGKLEAQWVLVVVIELVDFGCQLIDTTKAEINVLGDLLRRYSGRDKFLLHVFLQHFYYQFLKF